MFLHLPGSFDIEQVLDPIEQRRATPDSQRVGAWHGKGGKVLGKIAGSLKIIVPGIMVSCLESEQFRNLAREVEVDLIAEAIGTGAERGGNRAIGLQDLRFLGISERVAKHQPITFRKAVV